MSQLILKAVHFTCFDFSLILLLPQNHWGTWQAHNLLCDMEDNFASVKMKDKTECLNNSVKTIKTVFKS